MSGHDSIKGETGRREKGEQIATGAHLLTPPGPSREWVLDEFGAPIWIVAPPLAEYGPWATIVPTAATEPVWDWLPQVLEFGPAEMPCHAPALAMRLCGIPQSTIEIVMRCGDEVW